MSETLKKSEQMTLLDTPAPTSSRELGDGNTPSDSQDGQKTCQFGRGVVPVNHFPMLGKDWAPMTLDIYGQSGLNSSGSADLQLSLESRLLARLAEIGSPEYALTWRHWAMQSGPPICALRASGHRISGNGSGGWPTPCGMEPNELPEKKNSEAQENKRETESERESGVRPGIISGFGSSFGDRLDNPIKQGLERQPWNGTDCDQSRWDYSETDRPTSAPSGLVYCSDGKTRRTQPGLFPLANGVSNRVGKLRAYGNAIVPQVAAEFIAAFMGGNP